jgi:type IV secretory pathway VirB10-like protein
MRLRVVSAQTRKAGGKRGGGGNFERVAGQEGQHGESQDRLGRGVREHGKPEGAACENCEVADRGADCGCGKSAPGAPPKERNQGRSKRIGKQVAARGSEQMGQSAGYKWAGRKDGQSQRAFGQVGAEGGRGQARGEQQAQEQYAKGRETATRTLPASTMPLVRSQVVVAAGAAIAAD